MAIEFEMPLGMLFRKMYCAGCGCRLLRKEKRQTYERGETGFCNTLSTGEIVNIRSYTTVTYLYRCPSCGREISYENQMKVAKVQAKRKTKILAREDIPYDPQDGSGI